MSAPATSAQSPSAAGGVLLAEQCGPHVLLRRRDETPRETAVLSTIPAVPGNVLFLASSGAHRHPALFDAIKDRLATLRSSSEGASLEAAWLGVSDLGHAQGTCGPWLKGVADDCGLDVFAPDGPLTAGRGIGLYVNRTTGGTGWRRFGPGCSGAVVVSSRFPMPAWEYELPHSPVVAQGAVAECIPAGLAIRPEGSSPIGLGDPAFGVPLNPRIPKLVVGAVTPAAVVEIINRLSAEARADLLVVPAALPVTAPEWSRTLARMLGRPVTITTGLQVLGKDGGLRTVVPDASVTEPLTPLATVLRQSPGGDPPHVIDIAPAPAGWQPDGAHRYRLLSSLDVVAEVVPGGVHVLLDGERSAVATRFDPKWWTLAIGAHGREVTERELDAAQLLIDQFGPAHRRASRIRPLGTFDPGAIAKLESHAWSLRPQETAAPPPRFVHGVDARPEAESRPAPVNRPVVAAPVRAHVQAPRSAPPILASGPAREPVAVQRPETIAAPETGAQVVEEPVATVQTAAGPVATASPVTDLGGSSVVLAPPVADPGGSSVVTVPPVTDPPATPVATDLPSAAVPIVTVSGPALPRTSAEPVAAQPPREPLDEPVPPRSARRAVVIDFAERASTPAEQSRLAVSAGAHYTEALAAVNVGLSAWPMLRPEAKADYVAVCLLLGRGVAGAVALNETLANGAPEPFEGYLACLTSGLRRLPTHRKVVLRQEMLRGAPPHPVGTVLCEPGFLSASAQLDVTTPGADLDVLIWPVTARRTSELFMGRAFEEAVFTGGCRVKVLGLRFDESEQDGDARRPGQALLVRELLPGEDPGSAHALARDEMALNKLEQAWRTRRAVTARLVDDEDHVARLTTPMPEVTP
ncbi:hypothetical protein C8D87_103281 [Lentzea atacamensis]|uniref:Uncharacterized protein n=1 Tax=Lentzea atacamensis TaxID=531938 RepID=A0ABX9E9W0_9PSEU|nr:hypothetical protein [Lentzea atacamensis]RAS66942.1 hypothetical protein C8D87_103281 [Lentzea atacamensis]